MSRALYFCLLLLPLTLPGQRTVIDSLQAILTEDSPDSLRIKIYRNLCAHYRYVNRDSSLYFGNRAYELAVQNKSIKDQVKCLRQISYHYLTSSEFLEAKQYALEALELSKSIGDTALMAESSNALGLAHWKLQLNQWAIKDFHDAYDWAVASGNERVLRFSLNNLGLISSELGRKEEAIDYFAEVGRIAKVAGDEESEVLSLLNIAVVRKERKAFVQALADFRKGLAILEKGNDQLKIAHTYYYIADILREQGKLSEALAYCDRSLEICRAEAIIDTELLAIATKANILLDQKEYESAIAQAETGLQISENKHLPGTIVDFYKIITQAYEEMEDYREAFGWQNKYVELTDSLFQLDKEKEIAKLEISWATQQKETENVLLRKEKMTKDGVIARRTLALLCTGTVVIILLIMAALLLRNRRKTKLMNVELEERVRDRTEELEELNTQLIRSSEEIQRFAYIASHDMKEPIRNVGGFIGLIKKRLADRAEHDLVEYIDYVQQANWQLYDLVENIREFSKISQENKKDVIHADLNAVLKGVCLLLDNKIKKRKAQIIYKDLPTIYFNPSVIKMVLKRMVENAIKYNKQSNPKVEITYRMDGDHFILSIKDNGIGIAPDFQEKIFDMFTRLHNRGAYSGSGMGLPYCKKLLSNYGGTITVDSIDGKGSTFHIIIPTKIVNGEQDQRFTSNHAPNPIPTEN